MITVRLAMTAESRARFDRDMDRIANISQALESPIRRVVGDALALAFRENFESEGQGQWAPLSEAWTVPERRRLGFAGRHPILSRTGSLKRSVTDRRHSRHYRALSRSGSRLSLRIGSTDIRYNLLHFGGRTALNTRIPPRPMAVIHPQQRDRIDQAARWAIDQALGIR